MRLGLAFLLFLVAGPASAKNLKEWTILVYSAADEGSSERKSDFAQSATRVLKSFEKIKALENTDEVAMVLEYDASGDDTDDVMHNKEWRRRFEYKPNAPADRLGSRGIPEREIRQIQPDFKYDEPDTSDPVTLKSFINWAVQAYPAKHYFLVLQGHSWGKLGMMMDFHAGGKDLDPANLMKNYELRRVMEEVYQDDAKRAVKLIPHGKFDGVLIDACVSGQIDELLEWKDSFDYFVGTSLEIPFNSLPYAEIFDGFLTKVVAASHAGKDAGNRAFIEKELLTPMVTESVKAHGPGESLAKAERQADIVQMFAIRLPAIAAVGTALKNFVAAMPAQARAAFKKMSPVAVWEVRDNDENADLRNVAKAYQKSYAGKVEQGGGEEWKAALKSAQALEASLGYTAPNPSLDLTHVAHDKADGAWIHVPLDTLAPNRELPACFVLRTFSMHNWRYKNLMTEPLAKKDKTQTWREMYCNDELTSKGGDRLSGPKDPEFGVPFPLSKVLGWKLTFGHEVPAHLTVKENGIRILSLWVPKLKTKALDYDLALRFYATTSVMIEYVSGDPVAYLKKKKGYEAQLLKREKVEYEHSVYNTDPKFFPAAPGTRLPLFVAEAHSNGAHYKEGFGVFIGLPFDPEANYQNGRLPLEMVEARLGLKPFSLTLEKYRDDQAQIEAALKKAHDASELTLKGAAFYRLHRIAGTGWADLLPGGPRTENKTERLPRRPKGE